MSAARRSDGLLSAPAMEALLGLIRSGIADPEVLARSMRALGGSFARTHNTLELLGEAGVIFTNGTGYVSPRAILNQESPLPAVRESIAKHYASHLTTSNVGTSFQAEHGTDSLWVDSLQLPLRELGYPFMLIELGIATRESLAARFWRIVPAFAQLFLDQLSKLNREQFASSKFGEPELDRALQAQARAGRQAEEWVVELERSRLADHVFLDSIRRISETDLTSGYDILSFDSHQSLVHDRFIEVKSFRGDEYFYWSTGEIQAARNLGARYWLYLIDRSKMEHQHYAPAMISDPAVYFLDRQPEGWARSNEGVMFIRTLSGQCPSSRPTEVDVKRAPD